MATLRAKIDGQELSTVVSTSDLGVTTGKVNTIHLSKKYCCY